MRSLVSTRAQSATAEFVKLLQSYSIRYMTGDRYAGEWVAQAFSERHVTYKQSELPKSGLYIDFLPKLNSRTISIPDIRGSSTMAEFCLPKRALLSHVTLNLIGTESSRGCDQLTHST
jgi:hypothetical protein